MSKKRERERERKRERGKAVNRDIERFEENQPEMFSRGCSRK